jgi:hypothetical protein
MPQNKITTQRRLFVDVEHAFFKSARYNTGYGSGIRKVGAIRLSVTPAIELTLELEKTN